MGRPKKQQLMGPPVVETPPEVSVYDPPAMTAAVEAAIEVKGPRYELCAWVRVGSRVLGPGTEVDASVGAGLVLRGLALMR